MPSYLALLLAARILAQGPTPQHESRLHAAFRLEDEHVKESCDAPQWKTLLTCSLDLATDDPIHVAFGSLAPQNGFGLGGALAYHFTSTNWRTSWDTDAVRAVNGAWRAGTYFTFVRTTVQAPTLAGPTSLGNSDVHPYAVYGLWTQTMSLPTLFFFGQGRASTPSGQAAFAFKETITGGNAIVPVNRVPALHMAVVGEINGRFVQVDAHAAGAVPSIATLYTDETAPGLSTTPNVIEFKEGVRLTPTVGSGHLRTNYEITLQEFAAPATSASSFRRWTVDLDHTIPLAYDTRSTRPVDHNGPDDCGSVDDPQCPAVSRDRWGAIDLRALLIQSQTGASSAVPFYLQPTLGGSDINGAPMLSTYGDYRFRGPSLFYLREGIEHSIWGPLGVTADAEQGTVSTTGQALNLRTLDRGFSAGLTVRAGGFPAASLSVAAGGREGRRIVFSMSTSLLGGGSRPSLF